MLNYVAQYSKNIPKKNPRVKTDKLSRAKAFRGGRGLGVDKYVNAAKIRSMIKAQIFTENRMLSLESSMEQGTIGAIMLANLQRTAAEAAKQELSRKTVTIDPIILDAGSEARVAEMTGEIARSVLDGVVSGELPRTNLTLLIRERVCQALYEGGFNTRQRLKQKGLDEVGQGERTNNLVSAKNTVESREDTRAQVIELTLRMVKSRFPAEVISEDNETLQKRIGLSKEQCSDLSINFLFWALSNGEGQTGEKLFSSKEELICYLTLFQGLNADRIAQKVEEFEERDKKEYELSPEKIEELYSNLQEVLSQNIEKLMEDFLEEASFEDTKNRDVLRNPGKMRSRMAKLSVLLKKEKLNVGDWERHSIEIAETQYERCIEEIDAILAQRGNVSARNRLMVSMLRLIGQLSRTGYGRFLLGKYAHLKDESYELESRLREVLISKIAGYDPSKSRLTSYLITWSKSTIARFVVELESVKRPVHVHDALAKIEKHRPHSMKKTCEKFGLPEEYISAALATTPNQKEQELIAKAELKGEAIKQIRMYHNGISDEALSAMYGLSLVTIRNLKDVHSVDGRREDLDAPVGEGTKTFGEMLDSEKGIEGGAKGELKAQAIERVLDLLPPIDAEFLMERFIQGLTLEEMGNKRGLTREMVRVIEVSLLEQLKSLSQMAKKDIQKSDGLDLTTKNVVIISDPVEFERWIKDQEEKHHPDAGKWIKESLGIEGNHRRTGKNLYKRFNVKTIGFMEFKRILEGMKKELKKIHKTNPSKKRSDKYSPFILSVTVEEANFEAAKEFESIAHLHN